MPHRRQARNNGNGSTNGARGKTDRTNIVAYNFKKRRRLSSHPALHLRQVEQNLHNHLAYLKQEIAPKHYVMVLEVVVFAGHHQRLTDKVLLRHLKAIHDLI